MKILVLGAQGQLGRSIQRLVKDIDPRQSYIFWGRSEFALDDPSQLAKLDDLDLDVVINCAAYTAVDKAEVEKALAYAINVEAVGRLGAYLNARDISIVHISSDYVYHNYLRRPLRETDPCRPKGYYAKTKWWGEQMLQKTHKAPLILRVSWLYGRYGNNFPKTMLRLAKERDEINVVKDQVGAPTYAYDLATSIISIIDRYANSIKWADKAGIYNFCNGGQTNWYEIARHVVSKAKLQCQISAIRSIDYPTAAPRPRYSVLDLTEFERNFDLPILHWRERLDACLDQIINEST